MPQRPISSIAVFSLFCLAGAILSGCVVANRPSGYGYMYPGPGPVLYDYRYYPSAQVYYDINRGVYFYLSTGGVWIETRSLPSALRIRLGTYVPIHSRYARPYREYDKHRRAYPPRYRERERQQERREDDRRSYPRYQQPPPNWRELNQGYEPRKEPRNAPGYRDRRYDNEPAQNEGGRRYERNPSQNERERRYERSPAQNDRERRSERNTMQRGEPPRKYPVVKKSSQQHTSDKKQNNKKQGGKNKKHEDNAKGKDKGKSKGKDKKGNRKDRSDDRNDPDNNRRRDWERRER